MSERLFRPSRAHKLEDPERPIWLPPADVLAAMNLRAGMTIVDVGAGTGYFALPIATAILPDGEVFAVDLQPEMLDLLRAKLNTTAAPHNIVLVEGSAENTQLPNSMADRILIANVWHELDDHAAALVEAKRVLVKGGRFAILDWRTDVTQPPGPPLHHRIAHEDVRAFVNAAGWDCEPVRYIGPYSYLLLCSPPA